MGSVDAVFILFYSIFLNWVWFCQRKQCGSLEVNRVGGIRFFFGGASPCCFWQTVLKNTAKWQSCWSTSTKSEGDAKIFPCLHPMQSLNSDTSTQSNEIEREIFCLSVPKNLSSNGHYLEWICPNAPFKALTHMRRIDIAQKIGVMIATVEGGLWSDWALGWSMKSGEWSLGRASSDKVQLFVYILECWNGEGIEMNHRTHHIRQEYCRAVLVNNKKDIAAKWVSQWYPKPNNRR